MTIAYVGNYTQRHCTEVHLALTLEALGHEVIRLQENELADGWVGNLLRSNPELNMVLYTRTWGDRVTLADLAYLRERQIVTASYHLDLYVGLARKHLHQGKTLEEVLQTDPFWRTDFVFTPDNDPASQEIFKQNGVNHYYMKPGVYKPECYTAQALPDSPFEKIHDVLFVGGGDYPGSPNGYGGDGGHPEWQYRDELIQWLRETYGDRFTKFGNPQPTVRNEDLNQLYAKSKVVVGDSVCIGFNHSYYWSDRVYETIGRGGFLIHPYIKGLEEEFTDGETIVFYEYGNWDQLKEKIDYYLGHEDEREQIRLAGHEFVKNHATYNDRMAKMLDIISFVKASNMVLPQPKNPFGKGIVEAAPIKINLGAGSEPTEGWVNVDWLELPGIDVVQNLLETPWNLPDNSASEIKAIDVLEHMPNFTPDNKSTPIAFVEECHRILQPGGKLFITVPHWQSPNLWIDPTHVRGYDEKSMDYFDPDTDHGKWYGYYSEKKFKVSAVRTPNNNVEFTMVKR